MIVLFGDEPTGAFQTWLIASVIVSGISLVIDVADVVAYLRGERSDLLSDIRQAQ